MSRLSPRRRKARAAREAAYGLAVARKAGEPAQVEQRLVPTPESLAAFEAALEKARASLADYQSALRRHGQDHAATIAALAQYGRDNAAMIAAHRAMGQALVVKRSDNARLVPSPESLAAYKAAWAATNAPRAAYAAALRQHGRNHAVTVKAHVAMTEALAAARKARLDFVAANAATFDIVSGPARCSLLSRGDRLGLDMVVAGNARGFTAGERPSRPRGKARRAKITTLRAHNHAPSKRLD